MGSIWAIGGPKGPLGDHMGGHWGHKGFQFRVDFPAVRFKFTVEIDYENSVHPSEFNAKYPSSGR